MSFDFNNINPLNNSINKAQATYKDGGGLGGGGMYMRQGKKKKDDEDDIFESSQDNNSDDIVFDSELKEEEIPQESIVNKFVNWFRIGKK